MLNFLPLQGDRLKQVLDHVNTLKSLCLVLGMDFKHAVSEVHPSLDHSEGAKNISNDTVERFIAVIKRLREAKIQRMQKVSFLVAYLFSGSFFDYMILFFLIF